MPEKILGLDIGASALKAVLLARGFRGRHRLLGFRVVDVVAAGGPAEAVKQLFAEDEFRGSVCVTAIPAGAAAYRNIRLPFRDRRKILQALPFAVEPLIQTPLDDIFVDYALPGRTGQAEIFAALAPRPLVGERTSLLAEYARDTAVIDIAAVPLNPGIIDTEMLRCCFGPSASAYPAAAQWARRAVPFLLGLGAKDNGQPLTVPG